MKNPKKAGVSVLSLLVLMTMLMPWMTISCEGVEVATLNGVNTAMGTTIEGEELNPSLEVILVILLALFGLAGVVLARWLSVGISVLAVLSLVFFFFRVAAEAADTPGLEVSFRMGYWLCLLFSALIGILQFLPLEGFNRGSEAEQPETSTKR